MIDAFKKTGDFARKKPTRKKLFLPETEFLKRKLREKYFEQGSIGKSIKDVVMFLRDEFQD